MKMHRFIGAIAAGLCLAGSAHAATVTITGTNPTTNTDNTTIPANGEGSLTQLRLEYGTCVNGAFGTKAGEVTRTAAAPGANFSHTLNLNPSTSCVRAFVSNTYGVESDPSNVVTRTVDPPKPRPPQLTTTAPQVYDVRPNEQTFAFDRGRQVGTVKLGAACDEDRSTPDGFYALERPSRVAVTRAPRSSALVAQCGEPQATNNLPSQDGHELEAAGATVVHVDDGGRVLVGSGDDPAA